MTALNDITIDLNKFSLDPIETNVLPSCRNMKNDQDIKKNRNKQCLPSDDEEEDEDDEEDEEEEDAEDRRQIKSDSSTKPRGASYPGKPTRKSQPLPSDDEDEEEEDDEDEAPIGLIHPQRHQFEEEQEDEDDNIALLANRDPNAGPVLTLVEGTHLQQLYQQQQYHQQQLQQFQYHQQQQRMTGMDLLKQLEQEKADLKRQKPKVVPKINHQSLLGQLPVPGSHNISFQQLQMQQRKSMHYLDPRGGPTRSRSPSPVHFQRAPSPYY